MQHLFLNVFAIQYKPRPNPKDWKQITEIEVYKNDNTLRDYQLEGLNWLTFSYCNRYTFAFCKIIINRFDLIEMIQSDTKKDKMGINKVLFAV